MPDDAFPLPGNIFGNFTFKVTPPLSAPQQEVAISLVESCSAVALRASEAVQYGLGDVAEGQQSSNAERLGLEAGQLLHMIEMALDRGMITVAAMEAGRMAKRMQMERNMKVPPT